ncbi:MAG TPA: DUF3857 domain-containing protein [Steroidobacteraceae bacterium]|nr:DUF3857 domain-containing protein [Steroidobacteraceae bacterium]
MRRLAFLKLMFWCLVPGLLPWSASAASPVWRVAPRAAWVQGTPAGTAQPLHDRQIRVTAEGDDRYEHTLLPLTREQAAEQASPVTISLDPRYQTLEIHALHLTHAADATQEFTAAQIRGLVKTRATETDPHQLELNPQLQVSLQIPGAQAGDLLECEYTVHSLSARFAGLIASHYASQWLSGGEQPLRWERLRVQWPRARNLQYRISPSAAAGTPQVRSESGELEILWRDEVPPAAEADTPRWFSPRSVVQLSDFADWTQVATLLAAQYGATDSVEQQPSAASASPQMILDALRLVQDKIHAFNVGTGPFLPTDPSALLQRGFGDSRDLARLLLSVLRRLGVDAQVALADSHRGALLDEALPSPYILDAALVLVRSGTTRYWINPAGPGRATQLPTTDSADLRHALLIAPSGGKVVLLPPPLPDSWLRTVLQQFDLRPSNGQPATLSVTTRFHGGWAQAVRADLLGQSRAQLRLTQMQGVAQDYPDASPDGEVQLQDLPGSQTLELTARFRLPRPFADPRRPQFSFFAEGLADAVQPRDEPTRRLPLSVPWPLKLEQHIAASLPPSLRVLPGRVVIENPAFRYQREVRFAPGRLDITHSYVALSDHVDPADYSRYLAANARVYQLLGLQVQADEPGSRRALEWLENYWLTISATVAVIITLALGAWRRLRRA